MTRFGRITKDVPSQLLILICPQIHLNISIDVPSQIRIILCISWKWRGALDIDITDHFYFAPRAGVRFCTSEAGEEPTRAQVERARASERDFTAMK
eukprot:744474-Amorphochlora_amoeboformis.AAC.1